MTFGPHVQVLAHDASMHNVLGYTKIGRVRIGNNVFIGAGSIVLPNVQIGDNSIVGAGSIVTKDISPNVVSEMYNRLYVQLSNMRVSSYFLQI